MRTILVRVWFGFAENVRQFSWKIMVAVHQFIRWLIRLRNEHSRVLPSQLVVHQSFRSLGLLSDSSTRSSSGATCLHALSCAGKPLPPTQFARNTTNTDSSGRLVEVASTTRQILRLSNDADLRRHSWGISTVSRKRDIACVHHPTTVVVSNIDQCVQ